MNREFRLSVALAVIFMLITGCGSGNPAIPLDPSGQNQISGYSGDISGTNLWGFWDVEFDSQDGEFELVPVRYALFQANVTRFLQPPSAPIHMLSISLDLSGCDIPNGKIACNVTIRHPFVGYPKLRGFDVMGIVMGNGSSHGWGTGDIWPSSDELRILNADGYTRWWNPTEFTTYNKIFGYTHGAKATSGFYATSTINGHKYFADDLDAKEPVQNLDLISRGTFSGDPGINTRYYVIQFPMVGGVPYFRFNYAITASYEGPISDDDPKYPVTSFSTSANIQEAFRIDVKDAGSTAYWENENTYGGDLKLDIEVFDWGLANASTGEEEISAIVFSGNLIGGIQYYYWPDFDWEPGTSEYSRIFHFVWPDVHPDGVLGQELFIGIRSAHPTSYAPDIPGLTGFDYPVYAPLEAFTIYEAKISPTGPGENTPPKVGVVDGQNHIFQSDNETYTLSFANDTEDGTNLTILWDNDGDGIFDDDVDGNDTDLAGTLVFPVEGFHDVIARALDSGGLYTDSEPFEVYVEGCPTEMHSSFQSYQISDGTDGYYVRMAGAYQTVGQYAGYLLVQNKPGKISAYDTSKPAPWTAVPYINIKYTYNSSDKAYEMDVCDFSGRVIITMMNEENVLDPGAFQVYDVNGNWLTTMSVSQPAANRDINAFDVDDNGDLWIATWEDWHDDNGNKLVDEGEGNMSRLQHFVYSENVAYYIEDVNDTCDISAQFPGNNQMWDLAVSYTLDRIYAMRGSYWIDPIWAPYGEIYSWDIQPDGSLILNEQVQNLHVFANKVCGSYTTFHGSLVGGDIDIDHSWEKTEDCRLIIMAQKVPAYNDWGHYFSVMDSNLNTIASVKVAGQIHRYHFAIRNDEYPFNRELCTVSYNQTNEVHVAPAPPGW